MKKNIILLFCIAQLSTIFAQNYTPFPMENAVWAGSYSYLGFNEMYKTTSWQDRKSVV